MAAFVISKGLEADLPTTYTEGSVYFCTDTGNIYIDTSSTSDGRIQTCALSATQLRTARTIRTNLASTSTASFNGTANITPGVTGTLAIGNGGTGTTTGHIAITQGTNTTSTASPAHGGTFTAIDSITKDTYGHVTAVNTKTITLPADNNTDTKVTQTVSTSAANYPLLLAPSGQTATTTTSAYFGTAFQANPSTGALTATSFSGSGASLTSLNASNISSGTLAAARLAASGVTAGSYGPSAAASPAHSGTFSVPYITVDSYGRVTAAATQTITLPSDNNTDTKVTQTVTTTSASYPLLLAPTGQTASTTTTAYFGTKFQANPSTGVLTATTFSGSGASLTSLNASNISSGTLAAARLATSGVTAGSYGPSANASPSHGGTFSVPYVTVDTYGRVTAASTKTITLPTETGVQWGSFSDLS